MERRGSGRASAAPLESLRSPAPRRGSGRKSRGELHLGRMVRPGGRLSGDDRHLARLVRPDGRLSGDDRHLGRLVRMVRRSDALNRASHKPPHSPSPPPTRTQSVRPLQSRRRRAAPQLHLPPDPPPNAFRPAGPSPRNTLSLLPPNPVSSLVVGAVGGVGNLGAKRRGFPAAVDNRPGCPRGPWSGEGGLQREQDRQPCPGCPWAPPAVSPSTAPRCGGCRDSCPA